MREKREAENSHFITALNWQVKTKLFSMQWNYLFSEWKDKQTCVGFRSVQFTQRPLYKSPVIFQLFYRNRNRQINYARLHFLTSNYKNNQCFLSCYAYKNETDGQLELQLFFNSHPWWIGKPILVRLQAIWFWESRQSVVMTQYLLILKYNGGLPQSLKFSRVDKKPT